jgi:hypothetical protein
MIKNLIPYLNETLNIFFATDFIDFHRLILQVVFLILEFVAKKLFYNCYRILNNIYS